MLSYILSIWHGKWGVRTRLQSNSCLHGEQQTVYINYWDSGCACWPATYFCTQSNREKGFFWQQGLIENLFLVISDTAVQTFLVSYGYTSEDVGCGFFFHVVVVLASLRERHNGTVDEPKAKVLRDHHNGLSMDSGISVWFSLYFPSPIDCAASVIWSKNKIVWKHFALKKICWAKFCV